MRSAALGVSEKLELDCDDVSIGIIWGKNWDFASGFGILITKFLLLQAIKDILYSFAGNPYH